MEKNTGSVGDLLHSIAKNVRDEVRDQVKDLGAEFQLMEIRDPNLKSSDITLPVALKSGMVVIASALVGISAEERKELLMTGSNEQLEKAKRVLAEYDQAN